MMNRDVHDNMVTAATTTLETLKIIDTHGVPIGFVHDDGVLSGTVTDGDIRRGILAGVPLTDPVEKVINTALVTAPAEMSDEDAARLMRQRGIGHLPLIDDGGRIVALKVLKDFDPKPHGGNSVVFMAGGRGTRLQPLTEDIPKPLLNVSGRPILETIIERFVAQGFTRIFLSVNYKAELIEEHFGDGQAFGADISYLREEEARGTGGTLALLPERPSEPVIVMNGDVLTKINFHHLIKYHENHDAPATMGVREYRFTVPFGLVETEAASLVSIAEKPEHTLFVNAGIYVIGPDALDLIPAGEAMDMPNLFQRLLDDGKKPTVFPLRGYWMDIGRFNDLDQAKRDYAGLFTEDSAAADHDTTGKNS